jgi:hypothetical protein
MSKVKNCIFYSAMSGKWIIELFIQICQAGGELFCLYIYGVDNCIIYTGMSGRWRIVFLYIICQVGGNRII